MVELTAYFDHVSGLEIDRAAEARAVAALYATHHLLARGRHHAARSLRGGAG